MFKLKKLKGYGVYDLTEVKFTVDFYPQAVGFRSTLEEVPEWVKHVSNLNLRKASQRLSMMMISSCVDRGVWS